MGTVNLNINQTFYGRIFTLFFIIEAFYKMSLQRRKLYTKFRRESHGKGESHWFNTLMLEIKVKLSPT